MAIDIKSPAEIELMRQTCLLAAATLKMIGGHIAAGVSTDRLDRICHEYILDAGAIPAPLNYKGFPRSVCTSVNEVVCHGIPREDELLRDGDIVNVDVTIYLDGVHGDTSVTFPVGEVDPNDRRLIEQTYVAMNEGIAAIQPDKPVNVIGRAIERHARRQGLGVVREFIGHGIGTEFHSGLQVPHYHDPRARTIMEPGMTFTVEPMLTLGDPACALWDDDWTAVTLDGRRTAQFEHTLLVLEEGVELLTVLGDGTVPAEALVLQASA